MNVNDLAHNFAKSRKATLTPRLRERRAREVGNDFTAEDAEVLAEGAEENSIPSYSSATTSAPSAVNQNLDRDSPDSF